MQMRILEKLHNIEEKKTKRKKIMFNLGRNCFGWTDTLLTETEKQAVKDILGEYYNIFARHRVDVGINTEFKVKIALKGDKALYCQNLPMPIHMKEDSIVELTLCTNMWSLQSYPSQSTQALFLHRKNPTENYVSLCISGKSIP